MQLSFSADRDMVANVSPAGAKRFRELMQTNPVLAADLLKDMLFDLQGLYNEARVACGFSEMEFPFP